MSNIQFKANCSKQDLQKWINAFQERALYNLIQLFEDSGEYFVRDARLNGNYDDWSGNLRSSIGYIVLHDGIAVRSSSFEPIQGKPFKMVEFTTKDGKSVKFKAKITEYDGSRGSSTGSSFINQLSLEYSNGIVLILCAGMEYAAAVEANGKDVITGASIRAKNYLETRLSEILKTV